MQCLMACDRDAAAGPQAVFSYVLPADMEVTDRQAFKVQSLLNTSVQPNFQNTYDACIYCLLSWPVQLMDVDAL